MLQLAGISKSYPSLPNVLRGLSATIGTGVFGLLGPNGAGKSTLIEILAGNLLPSAGSAVLNDVDVVADPARWRRQLGYLAQGFDFPGQTTGREILFQVAALRGHGRAAVRDRVEALLQRANLLDAADRYAAGYSRGMKQRLGIILALLADPPLLLLDEPTAGLDPVERLFFRELLAEVASSRVVILSTHIVGDIERCCSRVGVLWGGNFAFDGTPSELAARASAITWEMPFPPELEDAIRSRQVVAMFAREGEPWARVVSVDRPSPDARAVEPGLGDGYVALVEGAVPVTFE